MPLVSGGEHFVFGTNKSSYDLRKGNCRFSPYSKRLFSGYSGFPLSSKTNISKFQFDPEFEGPRFVSRKVVRCYPLLID